MKKQIIIINNFVIVMKPIVNLTIMMTIINNITVMIAKAH